MLLEIDPRKSTRVVPIPEKAESGLVALPFHQFDSSGLVECGSATRTSVFQLRCERNVAIRLKNSPSSWFHER